MHRQHNISLALQGTTFNGGNSMLDFSQGDLRYPGDGESVGDGQAVHRRPH